MKSYQQIKKEMEELQKALEERANLILAMRQIHLAEKFDAKTYYKHALEYKKLDIKTRQLELAIIGLH